MRSLTLLLLTLSSLFTHAQAVDVLTCSTTVKMDGTTSVLEVNVYREGSKYGATTISGTDGRKPLVANEVVVDTKPVRARLSPETDPEGLNVAEQLILHAMTLEAMTDDGAKFTTGLDLSKVRSATVYRIDPKPTDIGMAAIVDARDADGRSLGKFLGGLLIGACR